jgi:hypothetical protein
MQERYPLIFSGNTLLDILMSGTDSFTKNFLVLDRLMKGANIQKYTRQRNAHLFSFGFDTLIIVMIIA